MKRIYVNEEYCVGCGLCEVYCATAHSDHPDSVLKAYKASRLRPLPRVRVLRRGPVSFAWQCRHCDEPLCVSACITGALRKDPATGVVTIDEDQCVACGTCIVACPFGAVEEGPSEPEHRHRILKCDLCAGTGGPPACVSHCPNDALVYEGRP